MTTRMHAHDYIGQRKQSEWTIGSGNQIQFSGTCVASVLLLSCLANFFFFRFLGWNWGVEVHECCMSILS